MKKSLVVLASLTLIPAAAAAYTVNTPLPGNIGSASGTSYGQDPYIHRAIDVTSGTCGFWGVNTAVTASLSWDVTIRTTGIVCKGSGSGTQNEVKHTFADGWTFRQWNFIKTTHSYDRTCDRCQVGDEGGTGNVTSAHAHIQYDRLGTLDTSWMVPNLVVGQPAPNPIGYIQ